MPPDDRKGQTPSQRGRSPAPSAPDTPDMRNINAPPPPEAPEVEPTPAPVGTPAPGASEPADQGDGAAGAHDAGTGAGGKSATDLLQDEIAAAEQALAAAKARLVEVEEKRKAEEATARMVSDYSKEIPDLTGTQDGLRQYQLAETSFVSQFLDAATMERIAGASAAMQREIDELAKEIEAKAKTAAGKRAELDAAKAKAAVARARAEALKRPAASIRDRLKAADAIRAEAKKASDAGNYALAYWLIMDGGRLDEKVKAEPNIIPASELEAAVRQSASDQAAAEQEVATLDGEVKTLESDLQRDRAQLAGFDARFEARVRDSLAQFNPKSASAA